jgi:hypothetical protein
MRTTLSLLAAALLLAGCATAPQPAGEAASGDTRRFDGTVQEINNGCFADGVCSVTVDGTVIVTLVGWSRDTWGTRDPELKVGDAVQVLCKRTPEGCTLNGDAGYYVRKR